MSVNRGTSRLPDILRVSAEFQAALNAREAATFAQMGDAYALIERRLLSDFDILLREIAEKGMSPSRAVSLDRYKSLLRDLAREREQYATFAGRLIESDQANAVALAMQEAEALASMSLPDRMTGLMTQWNRLPTNAIDAMVGFAGDGSPLTPALVQRFGLGLAPTVRETMLQGVGLGWHPTKTVRNLRGVLEQSLLKPALTWARTETIRASRETSRRTYEANGDIVRGWYRKAELDPNRTCAACVILDGKFYPREADGSMPAMDDHVAGRCRLICATVGYAELLGIEEPPEKDWGLQEVTGEQWVQAMSPDQQKVWFDGKVGLGAFDAWRAGKFEIGDIPKLNQSREWGDSFTAKRLSELVRQ